MNFFTAFVRRADTPQKRFGLLLAGVGLLILIGTSWHWNVKENAFIRVETRFDYYSSPRSNTETLWVRDFVHEGKMVGYAKKCLEDKTNGVWRKVGENALYPWPEECAVDRRPEMTRTDVYWGIDNYAESMVMGRYKTLGLPMIALLAVGLGLYFGLVQRGMAWIRTGS